MKWRRASRRSQLSAAVQRHARPVIAASVAVAVATLGPVGARRLIRVRAARAGTRRPPEPLGPEAKLFRGSTPPQNTLAGPPPPGVKPPTGPPPPRAQGLPPLAGAQSNDIEVLVLLVDTNDHRYTGTAADLSAYRDAKHAALSAQLGPYWMEASFGAVDVRLDIRAEMLSLPGAFDDYFNRGFVAASLESRELAAAGWPRTYDGTPRATLHVRDVHKRDVDVVLAPNGTFADAAQLAANLQTGIDAITSVPADWLTCTASAGDLRFELPQHEVGEASFVRVRAPDAGLGLDGPLETPGDTATVASLTGKPVPGGFPLALDGSERVEIEVRDKDLRTRRYSVALPAGSVASPDDLAALLLPSINSELTWAEAFDAGPDRLGLRLLAPFSGPNAAIRRVNGRGLKKLGLFGFLRVDGVVDFDGRWTVRGDAVTTTEQALSLYVARRADDAGIPITATRQADLRALATTELGTYESFLVLFVEATTGIPGRRAGAAASGYFDLEVPGQGGFTFRHQVSAGHMLGTGAETWQTWAHEIGHVLGFWDLYAQSYHDARFDRGFDYVREWELMDAHPAGAHVAAWHKLKRGWVTSVAEISAPAQGATDTHRCTLAPIEYPLSDYSGAGSASHPLRHVARIRLSQHHWILVENRQPGPAYSQELPDDTVGAYPPAAGQERGGVFVTDAVDPFKPALYRAAVTTLNPHGAGIARGMRQGDALDLSTTYPAYDGIVVRVVGDVPGAGGLPEALQVEVEWGPGDFIELSIRDWEAPTTYGTRDMWIDWAGNGDEDYVGTEPPVGTGDATHWHPDGSVSNRIKVRVHNDGTIDAQGVVIRALVNTPMGVGDHGTFVPLADSPPEDIPAKGSRDFVFDWRPRERGHTCLRAEVFTHASALGDLDLTNNAAQENVANFHPTAGSPYDPYDFSFKLNSDYDRPIAVTLLPTGLADGMDLELERRHVLLAPDEEVELRARLQLDETKISPDPQEKPAALAFNLHAFVWTGDAWLPFGGITANVHPGRRSRLAFRKVERDRRTEQIAVHAALAGPHRAWQPVDAALVASDGRTYEGTGVTGSNGRVAILVGTPPSGPAKAMLYYFGPSMSGSSVGPVAAQVP